MKTKINTDRIRHLILVLGLNQNELAALTGLEKTTISKTFSTGIATARTLKRLADSLKINPEELLYVQ